ncbi:glycosyltransferase family 2 protein [Ruminiclostridium herbifermentans]|uniref:Glycosyltransferase family 2 protein n=1 Tax=Ruminiclostridium herbifermentans TaxID=2488810 RepID=A0A4U7JHH5_9FIRM|nr:glycosyltransferase family A protein [Ruminiclostridium herbifermentans]QNU67498.1 glycosyltransferase family 2 protein [Ruminiclostridium herbifermentans]
MNSPPLISVIIPMYNTSQYIKQTVESVLAQTYGNFEVIIMDDGSTDNGAEIVKGLVEKDARIKYFFQSNQGVSAARNNAIEQSQGEFVAFLDSDDLWLPTKLEKQINRLTSTGMDACYCGYQYFCEASKGEVFPKRYSEGKILIDVIKEKVSVWTSTVVVKKSVIINNSITFRPGLNWAEDMDFFYRLLFKCEFCFVKETLALYRQRPNSLSTAPDRLPEIQLWREFGQWIQTAQSSIPYNKQDIENAIIHYKIPSVAIYCLYQRLCNGIKPDEDFFEKSPLKLIDDYKLSFSETGLKLYIKKLLLRYKYGYK